MPEPQQSSPPGSTAYELALLHQRVAALEAHAAGGLDGQQPVPASASDNDSAAFSHRLTELEAHVTGPLHESIKRLERNAGLRPQPPAGGQLP